MTDGLSRQVTLWRALRSPVTLSIYTRVQFVSRFHLHVSSWNSLFIMDMIVSGCIVALIVVLY